MAWVFPGAEWFHHELIPSKDSALPAGFLDPRTSMAIWQLGNCPSYSFVLTHVTDTKDPRRLLITWIDIVSCLPGYPGRVTA